MVAIMRFDQTYAGNGHNANTFEWIWIMCSITYTTHL